MLAAGFMPKYNYDADGNVGSSTSKKVENRDAREAVALKAGVEAGLPPAQVLQAVGDALSQSLDDAEFRDWIVRHPGLDLDASILARIHQAMAINGGRIDDPKEAISLRWASLIQNPDLRSRAMRATFMRLQANHPALAQKGLASLPAELATELQPLATAQP